MNWGRRVFSHASARAEHPVLNHMQGGCFYSRVGYSAFQRIPSKEPLQDLSFASLNESVSGPVVVACYSLAAEVVYSRIFIQSQVSAREA